MCRVEVRLPIDTAALVYEVAVESDATISATMASLIDEALKPKEVESSDSD